MHQYTVIKRGQVYQPTLSGNGKVVAWRDLPEPGVAEIGIQREGEEPILFTNDSVADANPRLNQDGSVVVWERYFGDRTGGWDTVRREPGQTEPETILSGRGLETDADVSDDGNKVAVGRWSEDYRTRTVALWTKGEGERQVNPEGVASGLPQISGDGHRIFYLHLPSRADVPNEIWMQSDDGTEKPVVYETGPDPAPIQKHNFDTNRDGSVLAWVQKEGVAPAEVWKWDLNQGVKEKVAETPLAGQLDLSGDGSTLAWIAKEPNEAGDIVSRVHWKRGKEEKIVSEDASGQNSHPTLSDDGNTLVWMWKNPRYLYPNEIRKISLYTPALVQPEPELAQDGA